MTTLHHPAENLAWYALSAGDVAGRLGVDADEGLSAGEAERRRARYGPNELPADPPPGVWAVAWGETLGGTTVINSGKTGTLTMNAMTATTMSWPCPSSPPQSSPSTNSSSSPASARPAPEPATRPRKD